MLSHGIVRRSDAPALSFRTPPRHPVARNPVAAFPLHDRSRTTDIGRQGYVALYRLMLHKDRCHFLPSAKEPHYMTHRESPKTEGFSLTNVSLLTLFRGH